MNELDFGIAFKRDNGRAVKVTVNSFKGKIYIHLREYFYDEDDNKWIPTSKGISMHEEHLDTVIWLLHSASVELSKKYARPEQLEFVFEE